MKIFGFVLGILLLVVAAVVAFRGGSGAPSPVRSETAADPASSDPEIGPEDDSPPSPRAPADAADPTLPVSGRVLGPDGAAVFGARVTLERLVAPWPELDTAELEAVLTDREGRFRFRSARDEDLVVRVTHDDYAQRMVGISRDVESTMVRLEHGFRVSGYVVDLQGRGVDDCLVTVEPGPWSTRPSFTTRTADDGSFTLAGLSIGPLGYARVTARHSVFGPSTVPIQSVALGEPVRLQLTNLGLAMTGTVVQAGEPNRPIAGARVLVFPSTAWNGGLYTPYESETDQSGRFQVTGLAIGSHTVVVRHAEHSTTSRAVMIGRSSAFQSFELVPRSRVGGKLVGPIPDDLELRIETNGGELSRTVVAPDGGFEFPESLSVGSARIDSLNGACSFARTTGREATVTIEDAPRTELVLEVRPPSVTRGRVIDLRGRPVGGAIVSTPRFRLQPRHPDHWEVSTRADGGFEILGLPTGGVELTFEHEDFAVLRAVFEVPEPGATGAVQEVVLPDPGVIRGRVTRGGEPLAGATVFAGRDRADDFSAVTGPDGRYELRRLPAGQYRILSRWSTLPLQVAPTLWSVEAGAEVEGVELDFPPGRRVKGVVMDSASLPVAEARILVVGRPGALTATDAQGAFEMEVPEGDVELEILSPDFRSQFREPVPARADSVRVRLPWVPHGSIEGRVVGLPGMHPIARAFVRLFPLDAVSSADETTRAQRRIGSALAEIPGGRLRLDLVPAGRSRLVIQAPGFAPWVQEITVERAETRELGTVRLEPGAEVRGLVTDGDGEPIAGAWVHLGSIEDFRHEYARHTQSGRDGSFTITGVSPEATSLVVAAEGWAVTTRELRIPDDLLRTDPLRIVLERGSSIVVQLERDGRPADDFRMVALRRGDELVRIEASDLSGRVRFPGLPAGRWSVALFGDREEQMVVEVDGSEREYAVGLSL